MEEAAAEKLATIGSRGRLGGDLLLVLGQRLAGLLATAQADPAAATALSALPPRPLDWLRSLPPPLASLPASSKADLLRLHAHVLNLLSAEHGEASLATDLLPLIHTLAQ